MLSVLFAIVVIMKMKISLFFAVIVTFLYIKIVMALINSLREIGCATIVMCFILKEDCWFNV
jgi:hypothetical protein